jgi:UDP-N-acetylmuramyl pentapeptide phosphotransferase/UDP-N-acetylglucosamine-1-phosphate transferase
MMELTGITVYTFLLAWTGVESVRQWMERQQILALPNERSSHSRPTPSGGGLAILLTTLLGLLTLAVFQGILSLTLGCYVVGALLIGVISWFDDLYTLSSRSRLLIHTLVALGTIGAMGYWQSITLPFWGPVHLGGAGIVLTLLWLVGLTNIYNFMDGIDGLAGTQAVVAGAGWTLFGYWSEQPPVMALGIILMASNLGFLFHNWAPARIFMGDVGSAFLGYSFAVLPIVAAPRDGRLIVIGALLLWPFLFDASFTILRRWRAGENILSAHRSHLYQRLVIAGYSHRFVTVLYLLLALVGLLLAIGWYQHLPWSTPALALLLPLLAIALWRFAIHYAGVVTPVAPAQPLLDR